MGNGYTDITDTYTYTYDTAGNILSETKTSGGTTTSKTYAYGNSNWNDLLTAVNGTAISYDSNGDLKTYYNGNKTYTNLTWQHGRQLTSITVDGATASYAYDMDGIRTQKLVDGVIHTYVTQNGKVVREAITTDGAVTAIMDFIYDESGRPFALSYTNGSATPDTYYYVLNLQGDVVGLVNSSGGWVAEYTYNAWGEILSSSGDMAGTNPLRCRGYYYDTETGFYYLQSRYYDPVTHRFINADSLASTGQGILGTNMFAYCGNNPARRVDSSGKGWLEDLWKDVLDAANDALNTVEEKCEIAVKAVNDAIDEFEEWCSDTFSGATYLSNSYEMMCFDTLFWGYESGAETSSLISGRNNTPVVFYAQMASSWWKFDEYACGISFNTAKGGFAIGLSPTELTVGGCIEDQSLDIHLGANKLGYTHKKGVDYGNHNASSYSHAYLRPWTIATVCCLAYVTGGAAAGAFSLAFA